MSDILKALQKKQASSLQELAGKSLIESIETLQHIVLLAQHAFHLTKSEIESFISSQ